jgi:plastocyanin
MIFALVAGVGLVHCGSSSNNNTDAGNGPDAGNTGDAGNGADAGNVDGGTTDGGPDTSCTADYAGCTTFEDHTASGDPRTITFGGTAGNAYVPKCMQVKVGQTVTFSGDFSFHPLQPACGPAIPSVSPVSATEATVTFDTAGNYGYFCTRHGTAAGTGMAGAIEVVP